MADKPTVLLIDGKNLLYRSLMSKMSGPVEVKFPKQLLELRERYQPTFALFTWDAEGPTWRHEAFADYKAQREPPSEYERSIYARVPGWAAQCGYQFVEAPGWEADDIIGTYAARLREAHYVVIVSNDKDLTQLLVPDAVVMLRGWTELVTAADVERPDPEGWGVKPQLIPDLLAIMGDSSDNIPGVPKVGAKGAQKLIAEFGDVEAVIAACKAGKDKAKGRAERVVQHAEALRLFKRLTTVSCGVAGLPNPVPCAAMALGAQTARVAPDGMTVIDGVLYPLPETAHMAKALGWRWSNPTSMPDRKQAQLRPGEPLERWERDDHWAYLVERGGQWTMTHRGVDGDVETGKAHLGEAIAEFYVLHVAYRMVSGAGDDPWEAGAPIVALSALAPVEDEARRVFEANRQTLYAGGKVGSLTRTDVVGTQAPAPPAPPAAPPALPPPPPVADPGIGQIEVTEPPGVSLAALELDAPDGALAIGLIEFPAGVAPGVSSTAFAEIRVEMAGPEVVESAPVGPAPEPEAVVIVAPAAVEYWCAACSQLRLDTTGARTTCGSCGAGDLLTGPPGSLDADALRSAAKATAEPTVRFDHNDVTQAAAVIAAHYGIQPAELPTAPVLAEPPPGPWAIPADPTPGKETIPLGYAQTIVALTLEAVTGKPHVLCWDVDLKTDLGTPPDDPAHPNGWVDGRWYEMLCRLQRKVAEQRGDPAACKPLGVVVHGVQVPNTGRTSVVLDLEPALVNNARIANGPPPAGRWYFYPAADYASWEPRVELPFFSDVPF